MQEHSTKPCRTCGKDKPLGEYRRLKERPDGHVGICKACTNYHRGPVFRVEDGVCRVCGKGVPDVEFGIDRSLKFGISSICKSCRSIKNKKLNILLREEASAKQIAKTRANRYEALIRYGGLPPACACCGEAYYEFLAIDHIAGGGNEHRRSIGRGGGKEFCHWLKKNGYPDGFRVLCHNCNIAMKEGRPCPHIAPEWRRSFSGRAIHSQLYRERRRAKILVHYGGDPPSCVCCGESHLRFLAIDHINGGGNAQKKLENRFPLDYLILRDGYPDGYQISCHNCNMARGCYGRCPHETATACLRHVRHSE